MHNRERSDPFFLLGEHIIDEIGVFGTIHKVVKIDIKCPRSDILVKVKIVISSLNLEVADIPVSGRLPRNVYYIFLKILPKLIKQFYFSLL